MLDTHARKYVEPLIDIGAKTLVRWRLSANQVTVSAFLIGVMAGPFIYFGHQYLAVTLLWFSGYLDAVDGAMARLTKTSSSWGTVMDVTMDRVVEISVIVGLALRFPQANLALLLLSVSIIISMTVFLTVGAVSENNGVKSFYYQAGLAERTEGFICFSLMMLLTKYLTVLTMIFFGMIIFTALQRLWEARQIL